MNLEERLKEILELSTQFRTSYLNNETAVRDQLINPILTELGWRTHNPNFVQPNSRNDEGKIPDYTLLKNGKRVLIVEAKNLSTEIKDDKVIAQLVEYCYTPGIEFGVITNGLKWLLFNTFQKNPTERIVWLIDLNSQDLNLSNTIRKLSTIAYDNIELLENNIQKLKALEELWDNTFKIKDDILQHISKFLIDQFSKKYPKLKIETFDVESFVETKLAEIFDTDFPSTLVYENEIQHIEPIIKQPKEYVEETNNQRKINTKAKERNKIRVVFPDGTQIERRKVVDTFVETIKEIGIDKVKSLNIVINNVPLISSEKDKFYNQYEVSDNCFIMTHTSTKSKISELDEISNRLKINLLIKII